MYCVIIMNFFPPLYKGHRKKDVPGRQSSFIHSEKWNECIPEVFGTPHKVVNT